jgi:hypothetical protein
MHTHVLGGGGVTSRWGSSPSIWQERMNRKKCSRHYRINHLTSIIVEIERPDDGNVLIAQQISDI